MVPLTSLLLPIVVSAVIVFIASSVIHMLLPFHRSDMRKLPNEDEFLASMRRLNIAPGDYGAPHPGSMEGMKDPKFIEKVTQGPGVVMTVTAGRPTGMGKQLMLWFVFAMVVSLFGGYVARAALPAGADYLKVFQLAGTTAFVGYALGHVPNSIWYSKNWGTTMRNVIDGLVYGLLTGGTFGWLWPR